MTGEEPYIEALEKARKRARPGRPPLDPETRDRHLRMWKFWHGHSGEDNGNEKPNLDTFLKSLPDQERHEYESMDRETFRRAVKRLDDLMRPT